MIECDYLKSNFIYWLALRFPIEASLDVLVDSHISKNMATWWYFSTTYGRFASQHKVSKAEMLFIEKHERLQFTIIDEFEMHLMSSYSFYPISWDSGFFLYGAIAFVIIRFSAVGKFLQRCLSFWPSYLAHLYLCPCCSFLRRAKFVLLTKRTVLI